jgi:catechol 2,3-dioxygenase-like lactoylglutathione lyase family enzyme
MSDGNSIADFVVRAHHTAFSCADYDAAKRFFVDLLGFKVVGEMEDRSGDGLDVVVGMPGARCRWAMLELGGYHIELFKWLTPADGRAVDIRQNDVGYTHICMQVRDIDEVHRRLTAAGYQPLSRPGNMRGGRAKPFYCRGPEGCIVEFCEYPMGA